MRAINRFLFAAILAVVSLGADFRAGVAKADMEPPPGVPGGYNTRYAKVNSPD
jgi:hypothetical protein